VKQIYQIKEYSSFIAEKQADGYITLPQRTFEQLQEFILYNRSKDTDALELMGLSARKGLGMVITAKNYVGVISMKDGTTIEILPKIFSAEDDPSGKREKKLLVDMLKTLRNSPYKNLQKTNVNTERMNLFEIFIRMFIDEVFFIVKRGLKSNYETLEENTTFFKGKLLFSQQIRHNHIHKERSYVQYDAFTVNRPENRLIKSTLRYLYRVSTSSKNRNDIKVLLTSFADVRESTDYKGDFAKYIPDRNTKDYTTALRWCEVFLMGKSFTSFAGSDVAYALLFPMETLFESYVAHLLKKQLNPMEYTVIIQDKRFHLFDEPNKRFLLKPDIVVKRNADQAIFLLDTKWKLLSETKPNYGISQADMYQMYAYQKKYSAQNVMLLYPTSPGIHSNNKITFKSNDAVTIYVNFFDLFTPSNSIHKLSHHFKFEYDINNDNLP